MNTTHRNSSHFGEARVPLDFSSAAATLRLNEAVSAPLSPKQSNMPPLILTANRLGLPTSPETVGQLHAAASSAMVAEAERVLAAERLAQNPGLVLALSETGFANLLAAIAAALCNRQVAGLILRAYFFSDVFQEQQAESGESHFIFSLFELDELDISPPAVTVDTARNEVTAAFTNMSLAATVAFRLAKISEFFQVRRASGGV